MPEKAEITDPRVFSHKRMKTAWNKLQGDVAQGRNPRKLFTYVLYLQHWRCDHVVRASSSRQGRDAEALRPAKRYSMTGTLLPEAADCKPASRTLVHLRPSKKFGSMDRSLSIALMKSTTACTKECS